MSPLDRREFIRHSATLAGQSLVGLASLQTLSTRALSGSTRIARPLAGLGEGGYGNLKDAGRELKLPEGFEYTVIGTEGSVMSDGFITPGQHDGMCAFPLPNGNIRLIRNHEVQNAPAMNAVMGDPMTAYDPGAGGGTVSMEIDPVSRELVRDFVSLNGTWRNCAGGPTPWGSWLSCEEAFYGFESGFGDLHGYVFEVPIDREAAEYTQPIRPLGRFVHEALAVDPRTGIVYMTEDQFRAGFYQFLPDRPYRSPEDPGDLHAGGVLQMLAVKNFPRHEAAKRQRVGEEFEVYWVDIPEHDPPGDRENHDRVFRQGYDQGGAVFSRLEGCFYADGDVFFVATDGGDEEMGQVWRYTPQGADGGVLTLFFESPNSRVCKRPDNIVVSPNGCVVFCEDSRSGNQCVRGITPDGEVFDIAANRERGIELCGATFSPDGRTLFFNSFGNDEKKKPGMTYALWGPWDIGAI